MEPDSQSIEEYSYDSKTFLVNWNSINSIAALVSSYLGIDKFETSISFVSDQEIKQLNQEYRNKNTETEHGTLNH